MKEIPITGREFLSQDGNSCHSKDISVKGNKFIIHVEKSRKGIPLTGRKFL
jgi:hypothetical protein